MIDFGIIAIVATSSTVLGLVIGLWIHRSSGELETRQLVRAMKYAEQLKTGDYDRRYRDARNRAALQAMYRPGDRWPEHHAAQKAKFQEEFIP